MGGPYFLDYLDFCVVLVFKEDILKKYKKNNF